MPCVAAFSATPPLHSFTHSPLTHTLQVADFGCSVQMPVGADSIEEAEGNVPVRWTCPRALNYGVYSGKSDMCVVLAALVAACVSALTRGGTILSHDD